MARRWLMQVVLAAALMASAVRTRADVVSLSDAPWTAAGEFWTTVGTRGPAIDTNVLGHPIAIGGKQFKRGIAGHQGMSLVYNLGGQATRLTCKIGIDDEDGPRDLYERVDVTQVDVVFLVDRVEVLRKAVRLHEHAQDVKLNLRGAQQLEIRAESGDISSGFIRKRVAVADGEFETADGSRLIALLSEWHKRLIDQAAERTEYPAAPAWTQVRVRPVQVGEFAHTYELSNGRITLTIAPECGGRIIGFGRVGGPNLLYQNVLLLGKGLPARGQRVDVGGFFTQPQPRNYFLAPDPMLSYGRYSIAFEREGEVVLTSPPSWVFFLKMQYRIRILPASDEVQVTSIHHNLATFPRQAGIWSLTTVRRDLLTQVAGAAEAEDAPRKSVLTPKLRDILRRDGDWLIAAMSAEVWGNLKENQGLEWRWFPDRPKIRTQLGSSTLTKSWDMSRAEWPEMAEHFPAHVYLGQNVCELECHGPTRALPPGGKIELTERWRVR